MRIENEDNGRYSAVEAIECDVTDPELVRSHPFSVLLVWNMKNDEYVDRRVGTRLYYTCTCCA